MKDEAERVALSWGGRSLAAEIRAYGDRMAENRLRAMMFDGRLAPYHMVNWNVVNGNVCRKQHTDFINEPCVFERLVSLSQLEKAEAALDRVKAIWPHIELPSKDGPPKDPGPLTCLRCKIEEALHDV